MDKKLNIPYLTGASLLTVLFIFIGILILIPVGTYLYFSNNLSSKQSIMSSNNTGILLLDRNDRPFFSFNQAKEREFVTLEIIPDTVKQAVIASEDKDFFNHKGFSLKAILRSIYLDVVEKDLAYGGSTITQQLVKNALLSSRKNFLRKYQEIFLAYEIERRYSKNEILEMYLNSVYFGEGAIGIEDAAQTYFGKHAQDLSLGEASMLVGVLPAPSVYSPISGDPEKAKQRQNTVLERMITAGYITTEQKDAAEAEELSFVSAKEDLNLVAPHFALMVKQQLEKDYGEEYIARAGYKVRTTLDLEWQKYAEQVIKNQVSALAGNNVSNGAAVAIDPDTGEVRVLVGSRDWYDETSGKVNIVTSLRQPGSSFKPIVYAAALESRAITPATPLSDEPTEFAGGYKPNNYDKRTRGTVLVRRALANSLNIPTVEVMDKIGVPEALDMARRLGITSLNDPDRYGLSLALGSGEVSPLELTDAYATFANGGTYHKPILVLRVTDKRNKVIFEEKPEGQRAINDNVAFLIWSILSDNSARSETFGGALTISRKAAVKTGTTEDYRDAWTIGYTPQIAVGVWVGNNDNSPMDAVAGSLGAAPVWRQLMERYLTSLPVEVIDRPDSITERRICRNNGLLAEEATSSAILEYFISGTEPTGTCTFRSSSSTTPDQPTETPRPTEQQPTDQPEPTEEQTEEITPTSEPSTTPVEIPTIGFGL